MASKMANGSFKIDCPAFKMANGMVYRASRMANGSFGMETNELANHNSISMGLVHMASINGKPTKVLQTALKQLANGDNKPTRWLQGDCLVYHYRQPRNASKIYSSTARWLHRCCR